MNTSLFIGRRIKHKGKIIVLAMTISFLVMIIAAAVASGFRNELRHGLSSMYGDLQLTIPGSDFIDEKSPVSTEQSYIDDIRSMPEVKEITPVIYRMGMVRHDSNIYGVLVKGVPEGSAKTGVSVPDSVSLPVTISAAMSRISGLGPGDKMLTYFVGDKMKARQFNIVGLHDAPLDVDDRYLVYAHIDDMRRLNGWGNDKASLLEIHLDEKMSLEPEYMSMLADDINELIYNRMDYEDDFMMADTIADSFPQIFDWIELIDFNVLIVIILMMIVAGFNMISGLLIILFEHTSMIGLLKSMGMRTSSIIATFMTGASRQVLTGMLLGNVIAVALCYIQSSFHVITLDPVNYFVSYVPVSLDVMTILAIDAIAFVVIMLVLLIPSLFISRVDPARTMRMR